MRYFRLSERCFAMEKMKKAMEKKEMRLLLSVVFGVVALCVMVCTFKLICRKKKRQKLARGEMCEEY